MMNRRHFIGAAIRSVSVIGASSIFHSVSANEFVFPGKSSVRFRFAIASDGHYGQPDTPFEKYHDEMMQWLNDEHRRRPLLFSLFNGDLVHDNPDFLPDLKSKYEKLAMPYYISRGNHDRCSPALWESVWKRSLNYSFQFQKCAFVVLDTSNEKGDYLCPDLDWTRQQLERYKRAKNMFVFMHITPRKWTANGIDCAPLVKLFARQKNLTAIFHGHDHDQDYVKKEGGKPYFFDGHLGGSWGTDYRGYRIVEVMKDGTAITYQVNPALQNKVNESAC